MLAVCYEYMLKTTLRSVGRIVKNFFITNWIGLYFGRLLIRVPRAKKIAENWRTEEIFRTEGLKAGRHAEGKSGYLSKPTRLRLKGNSSRILKKYSL